ncbi:peptidoglycan-binding protein [Capillimicrobium parvum]|uniref:peptidoglycan-binding protein n=1 Tax=Capillimicrobium parvum TaxID=2884022 RepID=UPI00216B3ED2|nr:peptidoglycan-binding protein [Capillimicrobium parvum]
MHRVLAGALVGVAAACSVSAATPVAARAASANVAALQIALAGAGLSPGPVDGISGPQTQTALQRFQARRHLLVDGIAGAQTRRALGRRGRPALGHRPMRLGTRGWDVAALQFLLRVRGYGSGGLDGGFGPGTLAAVQRFQQAAGLTVDGIAGPSTLAALRRLQVTPTPTATASGPVRFLRPVSVAFTDGFGYPGGRRHTGLDYPLPYGAPVAATGVGVVAFAGWNSGGYGNLVVVRHRLGFETWYAHLSSITTSVGASVSGGTVIGHVGSTGHSTGPHLHFEVRQFGTPIDPVPYLLTASAARNVPVAGGAAAPCRPNADARQTQDTDPLVARIDRCP